MTGTLCVHWTISPLHPPRPWLHCASCGRTRPFLSSGRIRLNANGRRLDAWLMYRCDHCQRTWNRPIAERLARREVPQTLIEAWQQSTHGEVRAVEHDEMGLARFSARIEACAEVIVEKRLQSQPPGACDAAIIRLTVTGRTALRLDRLLARELGLSRSRLMALFRVGHLTLPDRPGAKPGQPIRDGTIS